MIHTITYYIRYITVTSIIVLSPIIVSTAVAADPPTGKLLNPLANNMGIKELALYLVRDILVGLIAPIVITLALLWTGFMFIQAQGKDTELATAKRNFLYVLVGAVLLLGAYVILDVVINTVDQITR